MPFGINKFLAEINKGGFSNISHYEAMIFPPVKMFDTDTRFNVRQQPSEIWVGQSLTYRINNITLPGRGVRALEYFMYGPEKKIATFANYPDLTTNIILSADLREREFILSWQDIMVGDHRKYNKLVHSSFDHGYYEEYVGTLELVLYNNNGDMTKAIRFIDAFPTGISDINYTWATDAHADFSVTWAYHHFHEIPIQVLGQFAT